MTLAGPQEWDERIKAPNQLGQCWSRERDVWIPINPDDTAHECRNGRDAAGPRIGSVRPTAFVQVEEP